MLLVKTIVDNPEFVIERLAIKNRDARASVEKIVALDKEKREIQKQLEDNKAEQNALAKKIGEFFKAGNKDEADKAKNRSTELKNIIKEQEDKFQALDKELNDTLVLLPNLPYELVAPGKSAEDNVEIRRGGENPNFDGFEPLCHWDLAKKYDIIDFATGVKITGAGFPLYKGKGAKLQRALINFFLDEAEKSGYQEVEPPVLVNEASGFGTGQLPDKEGQMYHCEVDNLYLVPTAEVPVTNIYRDEILDVKQLPIKHCAYTPCFRREAGSYGSDVKGLNRLHEFDKVELVQIVHPDKSYKALDLMVLHVENLLKKLKLPYRIIRLCGGDMSFTSAMTYDFEVWCAAQGKWLEVSSVSNFETFQANRLKLRFRDEGDKKTKLCHTLNGSGLALPRIVASILENYQKGDKIEIPEVLRQYTHFDSIE
ncbi:MAG: serine--tRNA ligase [Bacteroidales bacterium]|jgi:seryl-tRNA synthetase|nr:serine--tRNA ligase [Bacteroidales bacterium]MBR6278269.1 serine--tRNA ligase [Bacteroidales bacterium]